jgi:HEAT repeat protein
MTEVPLEIKKYISEILDENKLLVKSDLSRLTGLGNEDLRFLEEGWKGTDVKRRRKIVADLHDLTLKNLALDFSRIFSFCMADTDARVRAEAIAGLAEEEDENLTLAFARVIAEDSSVEVRVAAATALGRLAMEGELGKISEQKTEAVYLALLSALDKESESLKVKNAALEAIAPLSRPRVRGLIEQAYHSENPETRIIAITAMGLNCNRMWLTALTDELHNDNDNFRLAAVRALGELAEEDGVLFLVDMLQDENPVIQEKAIQSIGEIGGDEAKDILSALLKDPDQRIRKAAKTALKVLEFCEDPLSLNS